MIDDCRLCRNWACSGLIAQNESNLQVQVCFFWQRKELLMDSSFSVKHEHQTKKHLELYSSEFPALHLPTMKALWLRAPELNSGSRLPISEMEATHDLKISMVVLSHPSSALSFQWCRGLRSCFPSNDPTITVATDHLIPIDSCCNKLLHGSQLTATGIGVGQTQSHRNSPTS